MMCFPKNPNFSLPSEPEITMKKLASLTLGSLLAGTVLFAAPAFAAEGQKPAKDIPFAHEGPFGHFDRTQLQRGFKVYKEVCSACHSLNLINYRNLVEAEIFEEEQAKVLAAEATIMAEPDSNGDVKERPRLLSDPMPAPYANEQAARAANGGAYPPDLSLITKSRAGWYGTFNQLWNGIGGPQYVYSVLTGYEDAPEELKAEAPEGKYYNPYFGGGHWIGMPQPIADGQVEFNDGSPNTADDMARDVSAFLAWTAEPKMEERKELGFMVMIYLAVLAALLHLVKQRVWSDQH
jgi:ubiquinol-cytochrome c reductase cytochrome c1 subunit